MPFNPRAGFVFVALLAATSGSSQAQPRPRLPFATAALSEQHIAFSLAGDLWIVPRSGGQARRLLASRGGVFNPAFSPSGTEIAFSRHINGNFDAYVIPASGGQPRRLTYHPSYDLVCGWTGDGQSVLVASDRAAERSAGEVRLFTIPANGGGAVQLPFPHAGTGSLSPDNSQVAFTPLPVPPQIAFWRHYRGGAASEIQIGNTTNSRTEALPRTGSNDGLPMWLANHIYFVSDRAGTYNLFDFDLRTRRVTQLTRFAGDDIRHASASSSGDAIVFIQDGAIHVYDLKNGTHRPVDIRLESDFPEVQPREVDVTKWIRSASVSPDRKHALLGVRGEILKVNLETGESANLTQTPSAAEIGAQWSPDGVHFAYLSDESGEILLHIRRADGSGPPRAIEIEKKPSVYGELLWSPDSRMLALSSRGQRLFAVDLPSGQVRMLDSSDQADPSEDGFLQPTWSPDSRWIAFTKIRPNHLRGIFIHSLESGRTTPITDGRIDARRPIFDRSGRFLYFSGSVNSGPAKYGMAGNPFRQGVTRASYAVILDKDGGLTNAASDTPPAISVSLESISERIHLLPPNWQIQSTNDRPRFEPEKAPLKGLKLKLDPKAEWRLIYSEVWRLLREFFYEPGLHGQDLNALKEKFASYLPNVCTREDLNGVIEQALSYITVSHLKVPGGDQPSEGSPENIGLLGADFKIEDGRIRIAHVYRGDALNPRLRAPLAGPGLNIKDGDYLFELDGLKLEPGESFYRQFLGKVNKPCQLRVGSSPDLDASRVVTVTPVANEHLLRLHDWVTANRRKVEQLSNGRLAYIYLPDTGSNGYEIFNRDFFSQLDKQGVIVDERFNGGGVAADYVIDVLRRSAMSKRAPRDAADVSLPMGSMDGPRVMIINEYASSGGDSLPFMFRAAGLGPLVGKRTGGAAVGGGGRSLLDGGSITVPDWGNYDHRTGIWTPENVGVAPDIDVGVTALDWRAGRDPQLERAVQIALQDLQKRPPAKGRPKYPVYR